VGVVIDVISTCWVWTVMVSKIGSKVSELWPSNGEGASSIADGRMNDFLQADVVYVNVA
jgi:hypothetical protein